MKFKTEIGDITFDGGKINGVKVEMEFASMEEFEKYQATQEEKLAKMTKFFKTEFPEIINAITASVKNAIASLEDDEDEIHVPHYPDPIAQILGGMMIHKTPSPEDIIKKIMIDNQEDKPSGLTLKPKGEGLNGLKPTQGDGISFDETYGKGEDNE